MIESKSGKTRISAPARPSATDGRVSGLVNGIHGWLEKRSNISASSSHLGKKLIHFFKQIRTDGIIIQYVHTF